MSLNIVELDCSFYFITVDNQLNHRSSNKKISQTGRRVSKRTGYGDHIEKNHQPSKYLVFLIDM